MMARPAGQTELSAAFSDGEWSRGRVRFPGVDVLHEEDENGVGVGVITGEDVLAVTADHIGDFERRLKEWRAYCACRSREPETLQKRASGGHGLGARVG